MLWQHSSLCFILMTYQRWQSQNRLFVQRFFLSCAGTIFLLLFALFLCSFDVFASKEKLFHTFVFDFFYFIPFYFCFFFFSPLSTTGEEKKLCSVQFSLHNVQCLLETFIKYPSEFNTVINIFTLFFYVQSLNEALNVNDFAYVQTVFHSTSFRMHFKFTFIAHFLTICKAMRWLTRNSVRTDFNKSKN